MIDMETQKTILFVDDEETILDIAREHFENMGYRVLTAKNGREAVRVFERYDQLIDCCFTDINMPEMDGLELAEYLRKYDNSIPVIIMTGYPSLDNTLQTLKNGVVDFLVKPVNLEQMTICLQRVLRERELFIKNILLNKELDSKRRLEELNRELVLKVEEMRVLNRIMTELMALSTGSEVLNHIVELAAAITPADYAIFFAFNESFSSPFELASAVKNGKETIETRRLQDHIRNGQAGSAFNHLIKEIAADQVPMIVSENQGRALPDQIHSLLGIPLKIRNKVFGVLIAATMAGATSFSEKDLYYVSFMIQQAAYLVENHALYENIYENLFSTLSALVKTVEARDAYTKEHSSRVKDTAIIVAKAYGCTKEEIEVLDFAGRLHDIGKIGIRDDILLKPGPLTDAEYEKIKAHPLIGETIIGQLGFWDQEKKIVRHHHERFDGSGYPDGLRGHEIPLLARILSVSDAYDAMVSHRAYRKEMSEDDVLKIIRAERGTQFDPEIVDLFFSLQAEGRFEQVYHAAE